MIPSFTPSPRNQEKRFEGLYSSLDPQAPKVKKMSFIKATDTIARAKKLEGSLKEAPAGGVVRKLGERKDATSERSLEERRLFPLPEETSYPSIKSKPKKPTNDIPEQATEIADYIDVPDESYVANLHATDSEPITVDQIREALPPSMRSNVNEDLASALNQINKDPYMAETIKGNFISYTNVLLEGKWGLKAYLDAVAYVSYKMMGYKSIEAYMRTFPDRYNNLISSGANKRTIDAHVGAYNSGKLVNNLLQQCLIPSWVLNQHHYQDAINVQVELMNSAKSELVRQKAADSLMTHLSKPEKAGIEINIDRDQNTNKELAAIHEELARLANTQIGAMKDGRITTVELTQNRLRIEED